MNKSKTRNLLIGVEPRRLGEEEYYHAMANFTVDMSFGTMYQKWYQCFAYILRSYKLGYTPQAIDHLFHQFQMENWHLSSEHRGKSKEDLLKHFCLEALYISDRTSYDRLFRTHWFFINAYHDELLPILYPSVYSKEQPECPMP